MHTSRRAQIIRLLQTRDQHLPEPRRRGQPASGFVHDTLAPVVCPTCEGVDSLNCTGCGGRGWIEQRRRRDPMAQAEGSVVPAVMRQVSPYGLDGDRHEAARERDRTIDRLEQQLAPPRSEADMLAEANARPEAWELARRRMYARHDYAALDRGLDMLRQVDPDASQLLHQVYVYALLTIPADSRAARIVERGLAFLDHWLPDPIRAPEPDPVPINPAARGRGSDARALEQRNQRVRQAVLADGQPVRAVAAAEGLSVSQVNRIVKGEAA